MTLAPARLTEARYLAAAGVLILAALVGAVAGGDPKLAIAAAFGMAFVLVAVADLAVGVTIFATLTYLELAPIAGGSALSFAKLAGLTIAISWLAAVATQQGTRARLLFTKHPALTASLVFFLTWATMSGIWAEAPAVTWSAVGRFALNIALVPIVFTAVREPRHMRWVASALITGAAMAALYGLVAVPSASEAATSITAAGDLNRVTGTVGDPNLLASVLVVGVAMSMALVLDSKRSSPARIVSGGVALICLAAIFATVSRGGIIALTAALIASVVLAGPRRGRMALAATMLVVASVGYFAVVASPAQIDRLENSDGGAGRTDIWKIGWRMVEAHPLDGVGAGNFSVSSIHYLLIEPGAIQRDEFIVDTPAVAHNMYLEILASLGIPGLVMFLSFIVICLWTAIRAAGIFDRIGEDGLALIARGVAVGLISTLASDFFLSNEFGKLLWLLLSLGPAMLAIAQSQESKAEELSAAALSAPGGAAAS